MLGLPIARGGLAATMVMLTQAGVLATTAPSASASPYASAGTACGSVAQPVHLGAADWFTAVAMTSRCGAWAVGSWSNGRADQTLAERWDGLHWRRYPSASPGGRGLGSDLLGVAAGPGGALWAVGSYNDGLGLPQSLIERWTGRRWAAVASPDPAGPGQYNVLNAVAVQSRSNAFAVGYYSKSPVDQALIARWNGRRWAEVPAPVLPAGAGSELWGVGFSSAQSAWAVGAEQAGNRSLPLVEHWNGAAWTVVPVRQIVGALFSVAVVSRHDAWAVGDAGPAGPVAGSVADSAAGSAGSAGSEQTLVEHWNGRAWLRVASPGPRRGSLLAGVAASGGDVLAAGYVDGSAVYRPLAERWTGRKWIIAATRPNIGPASVLLGVAGNGRTTAGRPGGGGMAVGYHLRFGARRALAVLW